MEHAAHERDEIVYARCAGSAAAFPPSTARPLKRDYLGHSRSTAEIDVMRRIKAALDPKASQSGKVI